MPRAVSAVVLAAGEGTRMRSRLPKPIHRLCGKPMVIHVLDALARTAADHVVMVVGHGADRVREVVRTEAPDVFDVGFAEQAVRRGTGDAARIGLDALPDGADDDDVLVLFGDTPLLRPDTLINLVGAHREGGHAATLLVAELDDPYGYGRILRDDEGRVIDIVEEKEATDAQRRIREVNTGMAIYQRGPLTACLRELQPASESGEYYLTDVVKLLRGRGLSVSAEALRDVTEANGVNDRVQLAAAGDQLRGRINRGWARRGVTFVDLDATYLDVQVELGPDVTLYPGVVLEGATTVGEGSVLGPGVHLRDCEVGRDVTLQQVSATGARVEDGRSLGPFERLAGADPDRARIGTDDPENPTDPVRGMLGRLFPHSKD